MLSASYLARLSEGLVELYSQLEADIISNMAKRLKKLGRVTDSTLYQAQVFKETGGLQSDILGELKKYDKETQKELSLLFSEALNKSANQDFSRVKTAELSPGQQQVLEAIVKKSQSAGIVNGSKKVQEEAEKGFIKVFSGVQRATMTIASSASNDFVNAANAAFMQTVTGATDYSTALKEGVKQLAQKGVHTVEYTDSGKILNRSVEAMLRTNILTGINQTATQITLDNCEDMECDLVEVSAHLGARPEHEAWQGKIYSLTPNNPKYPYFYEACDYGSPTGICGINCRHSFYPYFPGQTPMYSKGELDEYKEEKIDIGNGQNVSRYEAEQQQRAIERQIRKYKREVAGLEQIDANAPETIAAKNKLYEWQQTARDFSRQTGLNRDYAREYVGTVDGKQPRGKKPSEPTAVQVKAVQEQVLKDFISGEKSATRIMLERLNVEAREVNKHEVQPTQQEIISRVAGGDKTKGSCSSVAFAYAANKGGYDVLDYRGGTSQQIFSNRSTVIEIAKLDGVKSTILDGYSDLTAAHKALETLEDSRQYYFATGKHAAIIQSRRNNLFYLEMQSPEKEENNWTLLTDSALKERFGCKKGYSGATVLIDIESLAKNKEFIKLMRYINTSESKQKKGADGYAK